MIRRLLIIVCIILQPVTSWWLLSSADPGRISLTSTSCTTIPGLSPQQRVLCAKHPDTIKYLVSGLRLALDECRLAFKHNAWNCTLDTPGIGTAPLQIASRESAYVYAIASAGVSHALARACSRGLIEECGCGTTPTGTNGKEFIWAGCSDNVRFGNQFGRKFIDMVDKQHSDARSLMNLHNNRVGRRLLANALNKECKCHGVSGSCVTKTCWKVVPKFTVFAEKLNQKYEIAQQVTVTGPGSKLMVRSAPSSAGGRSERYLRALDTNRAMKNELVYLTDSPNYCEIDPRDRECGNDCPRICCGRPWRTTREVVDEPCMCEFVWCCEVRCKTCKRIVEKNFCT